MTIKVLGPGCARCKATVEAAKKAVTELGLTAEVEKIEDVEQIMQYNVLATPGLVIDEKLRISGRVPTVQEIKDLVNKA
ncbi:MAG TPA: thioredoxin family protein [Turneriella sp.]|nr:thioredoxin family protein [Turneriella sp.]HNA80002.1 thioredoxin family protein [Turneriella sp.]HNL55685.1 thioredoxin family protein [Turneriella sp.]HNN00572.1 thioredoxin family protein [Turneriella sp.]